MSSESAGPGPRSKVARLLELHELSEFGDYLVARWTADEDSERMSLRSLVDLFNTRLVEAHLAEQGVNPVDGAAANYYESLTGDDVSSGVKTQVRRTLEQEGVDVEELESEFVSRQAIHTYLTSTRGAEASETGSVPSEADVRSTIDRLRERTRQVTASKLERLDSTDRIELGDIRVLVDIQVYCADCGTQTDLADLLRDGGCACNETTRVTSGSAGDS